MNTRRLSYSIVEKFRAFIVTSVVLGTFANGLSAAPSTSPVKAVTPISSAPVIGATSGTSTYKAYGDGITKACIRTVRLILIIAN